jgi:hypothetical protein
VFAENLQHPPQRFGGAPKQLIAHRKRSEKFWTERQLVETYDGHLQSTGDGCWYEASLCWFFSLEIIGNHSHPSCWWQQLYSFHLVESPIMRLKSQFKYAQLRASAAANGKD